MYHSSLIMIQKRIVQNMCYHVCINTSIGLFLILHFERQDFPKVGHFSFRKASCKSLEYDDRLILTFTDTITIIRIVT